jgi:hypothetical protein
VGWQRSRRRRDGREAGPHAARARARHVYTIPWQAVTHPDVFRIVSNRWVAVRAHTGARAGEREGAHARSGGTPCLARAPVPRGGTGGKGRKLGRVENGHEERAEARPRVPCGMTKTTTTFVIHKIQPWPHHFRCFQCRRRRRRWRRHLHDYPDNTPPPIPPAPPTKIRRAQPGGQALHRRLRPPPRHRPPGPRGGGPPPRPHRPGRRRRGRRRRGRRRRRRRGGGVGLGAGGRPA